MTPRMFADPLRFSWTADRKATVKKLWLEGKSAAEIQRHIGCGLSRNAVIGVVHRMGLSSVSRSHGRPGPAPAPKPAPAPTKGVSLAKGEHGGMWADPAKVDALRRHFVSGMSNAESAKLLGVTRNAVLAKRQRLGLIASERAAAAPKVQITADRKKASDGARAALMKERHRLGIHITSPDMRQHNRPVSTPPKLAREFGTASAPVTIGRPPTRPPAKPHHSDRPGKILAALATYGECHAPRRDSDPGAGRMDAMLYCAEPVENGERYCGHCQGWMFNAAPRTAVQKSADGRRREKAHKRMGRAA